MRSSGLMAEITKILDGFRSTVSGGTPSGPAEPREHRAMEAGAFGQPAGSAPVVSVVDPGAALGEVLLAVESDTHAAADVAFLTRLGRWLQGSP